MSLQDFTERVEQYAVEIINGRQRTWYDHLFRAFLFVLSHAYRFAVQFRIMLYTQSIMKRQNLGSFVVSVGNLTAGGTGKTPVVELLAKTLSGKGRKVAILSRGYRSKSRSFKDKIKHFFSGAEYRFPPKIVSNGKEVLLDSQQAGDEPFMLARNLLERDGVPGTAVVVDKDRVNGGSYAIRHFNVDTLLLDDGFQYMPLRPKINIVLVDSTNPFHNHEMLPIGLLREPICNLVRADYIFLTKSDGRPSLQRLKDFLGKHNSRAPIIECNHVPCNLKGVFDDKNLGLGALKGKKVATICGIAVPESFENYIRQLGATIVYKERYVDHHRYRTSEIEAFCQKGIEAGAQLLLTTEKDAVRIPKVDSKGRDFMFLRVEIRIISGQEHFDDCIKSICMM